MTPRSRALAAVTIATAALFFAGCATTPGSDAPTSAPVPSTAPDTDDDGTLDDLDATLLDDGRLFAVITMGSSTCVPMVDQVTAQGQTVSVTLVEPESEDGTEKACTADLAPRASIGGLPEGVDPTQEITLQVTYGDATGDTDVDGDAAFTAAPGSPTDYAPSAGWFDDNALVLLTWGSSTCLPVVESLEVAGAAGTATFVTNDDQVCTMDMAPRATILAFGDDDLDDDAFVLTLVGGGLDGDVVVRG